MQKRKCVNQVIIWINLILHTWGPDAFLPCFKGQLFCFWFYRQFLKAFTVTYGPVGDVTKTVWAVCSVWRLFWEDWLKIFTSRIMTFVPFVPWSGNFFINLATFMQGCFIPSYVNPMQLLRSSNFKGVSHSDTAELFLLICETLMKRSFVSLVNIYQADQEMFKHYYIANHHDFIVSALLFYQIYWTLIQEASYQVKSKCIAVHEVIFFFF